jgi:spermidine synthase
MSRRDNKLLALGGLSDNRHTMFKFCEPACTPRDVLFNGLIDGTYRKPFLVEEFEYRSMCFALDGCTQSEMRIDDPYALVNEYTRNMMGFVAFQPRPDKMLIIGLGGGSLVKFCHRNLATTQITAVEIDSDVLALRSQFFVPADDERLSIVHADGADHVARMADRGEQTNAILVDAYDHTGIANAVVERSFMENAKRVLGRNGVFVMNVVAEPAHSTRHIETVRQVFGESVVVIAMQRGGNLVVFAGQAICDPQHVRMALRNAERAERRLGLFFPALIRHLNKVESRGSSGARYDLR